MRRKKSLLFVSILTLILSFNLVSCGGSGDGGSSSSPDDSVIELPQTGQAVSYSGGDDGELHMGVTWPYRRFTDNGDETITDRLTGLMWTKSGNPPAVNGCVGEFRAWQEALDYVACLNTNNYLNHNDWRLPNVHEMESLVHADQGTPADWLNTRGFTNVRGDRYWSSTTDSGDEDKAWYVALSDGENTFSDAKTATNHAWPVRGGQGGAIEIPQTGQTTTYANNDDGDEQNGIAWPDKRFTDNGDGTVTDKLTGLIWLKATDCNTASNWSNSLAAANALQNGECGLTDGSAAGDWRLPNRNELRSLVHYGRQNQASWLSDQGFTGVQADWYWSSTTDAYAASNAWFVDMNAAGVGSDAKTGVHYTWPVRGGVEPEPPLTVFVTSATGNGNLGSWADAGGKTGVAAGDAICQAAADSAGLGGTYKAWLSDSTTDAYCHIQGYDGATVSGNCGQAQLPVSAGPWVRTDGQPFAGTIDNLINNHQVYTPVRYDENGTQVSGYYYTGTTLNGTLQNSQCCSDWTDTGEGALFGTTDGASNAWTAYGGVGCIAEYRLLCFQTGSGGLLPGTAVPALSKKVFVTSTTHNGNLGGLTGGDAICRARAQAAGITGYANFKAWLSDDATHAIDRFTSDGPWYRLDGVKVADNKAALAASGSTPLFTAVSQTETGAYVDSSYYDVWTGTGPAGLGVASHCNNWSDVANSGRSGFSTVSGSRWTTFTDRSCSTSYAIYCFED